MRTILSTLAAALGLAVPAMADDDDLPEVERDTVLLSPLHFEKDGAAVTDEAQNQYLWNELMKYKLWGTDSVIFNKGLFRIAEPSGYTGTAKGKVYFRNGYHTLGGPIVSGNDIEISYPGMGADFDSLLVGPVRAGWLVLPGWYNAGGVKYEGTYCFEGQVFFDSPDRFANTNGDAVTVIRRFIANVHKSGGKIYADWDKDMAVPGMTDVVVPGFSDLFVNKDANGNPLEALDGHFSDCPTDVPQPEKKLSVPVFDLSGVTWDPAVTLTEPYEETKYIQVPPITAADLAQSPKHVWYDKYVEDIQVSSHTGKKLYILMPSKTQNANKKTGRLTRVFSRDGFKFDNSANDMRIQVVYVNDDATWNETTQRWDNFDLSKATVVPDSNYAGNLLFYTPADVKWMPFKASSGEAGDGAHFQGTFMTSGSFMIYDHLSIAGQLIAGKWLWFESEFNGEFHYVPFNSPEIKTNVFAGDKFKEKTDKWYDMEFALTDTAHTEVSFDYCFAFFGIDLDTTGGAYDALKSESGSFAEPADLGITIAETDGVKTKTQSNTDHEMPLCDLGEYRHIVIKKGKRKPTVPEYSSWLHVVDDDKIEGDEYMLFKIMNLNGAVISGNKFEGGLLVKLVDSNNKPPHFVDLEKTKLAVPENATKAMAGKIKAEDNEGDAYFYEITGGTAQDLFEIGLTTGVVTMKAGVEPFDYEEWKKAGTKYTIKVELCDTKATSFNTLLCTDATFTIDITDVNEKPYFDYSDTDKKQIFIAENEPFASDEVAFTDYDTYAGAMSPFINNRVDIIGGDVDVFGVTPGGVLRTKDGVVLDYEMKNTYKVTLRVHDDNKDATTGEYIYPDLYDDMEFTVIVTDVEDGPKFDYAAYNGSVDENSPESTLVKMDHAINAKTTQIGATITYILLDESKSFVIDPNTGVITVGKDAVLDFETKNVYELKVVASDESGIAGQVVQTDTADVVIKLNDLNEKPIFVEPTEKITFPEDKKGYEITTLKFDDLDTAKRFRNDRFELVTEVDGFYLDPETGVLTTTRKFDYETEEKIYELTVRVYDVSGDENLSVTGTITVELLNVNEPPFLNEIVFTVLESDTVGTNLKKPLSGTDIDGPDTTFNFFIMDGDKEGHSTNEFFLDPATGVFTVTATAKLDYEKTESYSFKVRIRDEHDGFSDTTVTIKVVDVNEAPSVQVDTIYVSEDQVINKPFSTVKTDKDDPDTKNPDFRNNVYENTDGSEVFSVQSNGDVILLKPIDYESDSVYVITVRVTDKDDKTLTSTKKVVVKVKDVFEKSKVEITRVEYKDSVYLKPDSVFVNGPAVDIEWTADGKTRSSTDSLKKGCNTIIKTFKDPTKNDPGADTVVVCYSDAAPIVTVSANGDDVSADNIYTVVEKATKNDTAIYVNEKKNDIKVTVKDTASHVTKSFTVKLELDTVSVSSKEFKNIQGIADTKVTRDKSPASGITTVPENDSYYKNIYTETIKDTKVTVSYYTDKKGNDVKRTVVTSDGKTKEVAVIEVSYTTKIGDKNVTISYFADASTGERVNLKTGLSDSESVLSADGDDVVGSYKVSYTYTDKSGNTVDVSYLLDEKGKIAKNSDGNIGYNVGYTYVNKFGNTSREDVFIVLDQKGPVVKIESPSEGAVLTANFVEVKWTVDGVEQDTLRVQGLDNGSQTIIRVFRDKAGNESRDSVTVMVKKAKNIEIDVEKPVTLVDRDSVEKYFDKNPPKKDQNYSVTFYNYKENAETEAIVGIKGKSKEGSGKEPYPGLEGHLGPTLTVDARVPVVNALGGLATLDDIVSNGGMIALEGVDAANGKKISVSEYVDKYCTDEFKKSMTSDYSKMNLYWTTLRVNVWVYSNTGVFADHYSFDYDLDDPDYVNDAGLLKLFFEMKPDENGDVRTKDGRLYGTGAYLFKTEVKMTSKLRCTLPPISADEASKKKNAIIKSSDELLKSFGYRRPVNN